MDGLIALLDEKHTRLVQDLWLNLEDQCGLSERLITPFPHFTWQVAQGYDYKNMGEKITELTSNLSSFFVKTAGIGVFTGEMPVVFITIVKTPELLSLHQKVWSAIHPFGNGVSDHYSPENWIPHITLASKNLSTDTLLKIFRFLGSQKIYWEIPIHQFAIGCQSDEGASVITETYPLKGK